MAILKRLQAILVLAAVLGLTTGAATSAPVPAASADAALSAWDGDVSLYRSGSFTTQRSWLWCTAAGVQIVRNIVDQRADHSTAGQRTYFAWMRRHNRYDLPVSAGVDPAGWTAGLRHYVDDRYRLVANRTFDAALRSAVTNLRKTSLPVAITVSHGGHGWILTGFSATADPAKTASFKVTSVRVVGPLYGLQSKNGYDMPPNTKLTPTQLKRFMTPWKYAPKAMIWDGRYVTIQPIPRKAPAATAAAPKPAPTRTPAAPGPTSSALPASSEPSATPPAASATNAIAAVSSTPPTVGPAAGAASPANEDTTLEAAEVGSTSGLPIAVVLLAAIAAIFSIGVVAVRSRRVR